MVKQEKKAMIEVKNLKKYFNAGKKDEVKAIDDISFNIYEGETFGLVGESGSGKSTTGRTLLKLEEITSGEVLFKGQNIEEVRKRKELLDFRNAMQMIFQDPYASLNPRLTVGNTIKGALDVHHIGENRQEREQMVKELIQAVGLDPSFTNRYPKELSGGQCQRVGIARALAVEPGLIIADEAISALDVSIQAQVVNLLIELKDSMNLTYLFIAHDLSMVRFISDRIGVMNSGKLLEIAPSNELYKAPLHPYTESLLSAIPVADPEEERYRERVSSDRSTHQYEENEKVAMYEIAPEHFVYCHADEIEDYQVKYKQLLQNA